MAGPKRKGVSPIVSVLLLIVIAVAAAAVTYGFVMGFIGGSSATTAAPAMIRIESVKYDETGVKVYVRNLGTTPVTVDSVYIYFASNGSLVEGATNLTITIDPGKLGEVTASISLTTGKYYAKVSTVEGAVATSEVFKVKS